MKNLLCLSLVLTFACVVEVEDETQFNETKLEARDRTLKGKNKVDPVAEKPVAEEPVAEEPVAEEPVAEEPVAEEPVAEEPVAFEPTDPSSDPALFYCHDDSDCLTGACDAGECVDLPQDEPDPDPNPEPLQVVDNCVLDSDCGSSPYDPDLIGVCVYYASYDAYRCRYIYP